jgi:chromosomal replication initiation ATPase DnaA
MTPLTSIHATALAFGVLPNDLLGPCRKRVYADARKALAILLRDAGHSWTVVAGVMARSRGTVIATYQAGTDLRTVCKPFRQQLEAALQRQHQTT